ncbi:hypothetical protein HPB50_026039 [Hyalomma asiaticum]|uniref:Uncharacterized protein n=1 Tax=Hyalomma asiaticum TaxID=266040 RepID=A0ACB7STY4_HYAAI|nr:hypothetical protein HPB50_026039 [Hyalomma asiaticum]
MYNFIAGFLEGRSYQVEIGQDASAIRINHVGVPQGSVISPTLFNIAMYQLPRRLADAPGLKHAVYADDVTVWTHQGSIGEQEDVLQRALNIIHDYATETGLHTAPDKTEFVVIHGGRSTSAKQAEKRSFKLYIGNRPITRKSTIRILGMHLDENCTANTWFQRVSKTSKQVLHALRRISNRTRGVNVREMRQFAQAFLVSRIMYGLPYHPVNRTQMLALDRLLNEAKRIVTGLPRYTRLDALKSCSKLNNLSELVDVHIQTQETRLRATNAGRYTLMLLGYDIHKLPILPTKTSPWEITVLTDGKPLLRNMDPTQRVRRLTYAKRHAKATNPVQQKIRHQARLLRDCGHDVTILWVPAHCAELADSMADKHIAKQRRAAYLTAVGNPLSIPSIPSKVFTRRESVLLRRVQTGTLLTPFLLNRFHRGGTPPPASCPGHHKPGTLTFFSPDVGLSGPTPPDRAIAFWRALLMFLQDPAAPPVGDRLRDSHKIQAAPT